MNFKNQRKDSFLASIPTASIEGEGDELTTRCKFNFGYFCVQGAGQGFPDWNHGDLAQLLEKLSHYGKHPLEYWKTQHAGKHPVFVTYGAFPAKSAFSHPKHVPFEARWGRFRLEQAVRLVGFTIPPEFKDKAHSKTGVRFDCNCFYVVFLDADHKFYIVEPK